MLVALLAIWGWLWALPLHIIALVLLPFYNPLGFRFRAGKLEIYVHRAIGTPGAQTWGQITFWVTEPWDKLEKHEDTHTLQCQIFGPLMLILYPIGFFIGIARGQWHDKNPFEIWAYNASGVM